jgi:hypothetical protein
VRELADRRSRFAKTFETGDNAYSSVISPVPVHFPLDGGWEDMATLVRQTPGGWAAQTDDVRFGIEDGYLTATYRGRTLSMRPTAVGMVDRTAPGSRWQRLALADYSSRERLPDSNTIRVNSIFPGVDLLFEVAEDRVSKQFIVNARPNVPDPVSLGWDPDSTYLVFVWDVNPPAGAVVRDTETLAVVGNGYIGHADLVVEAAGEPVLYMKGGTATTARGYTHPVHYIVAGANVPFGEAYSYANLMKASFPLAIDPTVTTVTPISTDFGYVNTSGETSIQTLRVGDDSWDDPGDPYGKPPVPPSSGGGRVLTMVRWDLSSIGSDQQVMSARISGSPTYWPNSAGNLLVDKTTDWRPLDWNDYSLGTSGRLAQYAPATALYLACYGAGSYVVKGSFGAWSCSSLTGTWTQVTAADGSWVQGKVATNGSVWCRATSNTILVYDSLTDALPTVAYSGSSVDLWGISYANGLFVAAGVVSRNTVSMRLKVLTSPDGTTWTDRSFTTTTHSAAGAPPVWDGTKWWFAYTESTSSTYGYNNYLKVRSTDDFTSWDTPVTVEATTTLLWSDWYPLNMVYTDGDYYIQIWNQTGSPYQMAGYSSTAPGTSWTRTQYGNSPVATAPEAAQGSVIGGGGNLFGIGQTGKALFSSSNGGSFSIYDPSNGKVFWDGSAAHVISVAGAYSLSSNGIAPESCSLFDQVIGNGLDTSMVQSALGGSLFAKLSSSTYATSEYASGGTPALVVEHGYILAGLRAVHTKAAI